VKKWNGDKNQKTDKNTEPSFTAERVQKSKIILKGLFSGQWLTVSKKKGDKQ